MIALPRCLPSAVLVLLLALSPSVLALNATEPYPLAAQLDLTTLLPPPPAAGSAADKQDLEALLALQASRSEAQLALARADADASIFRFADAVDSGFDAKTLPRTAFLFERITRSIGAVVGAAKDHWNRPRPFLASDKVKPTSQPGGATYPSGHAVLARLYAIVLADLLPQRRREIFARGDQFAQGRLINGVHYPSDVDAGLIAATVIAAELRRQDAFRNDFAAAQKELAAWQAGKTDTP